MTSSDPPLVIADAATTLKKEENVSDAAAAAAAAAATVPKENEGDAKKRWERVDEAVADAVMGFRNNFTSMKQGFAVFDTEKGLLQRLESEWNWKIFTESNTPDEEKSYHPIDFTEDEKEASAAKACMPKFGIVAINAYLEAFLHKILDDAFDALYKDVSSRELEKFSCDKQLLLSCASEDDFMKYKNKKLKKLSQPKWQKNLEILLPTFFMATVKDAHSYLGKLLNDPNSKFYYWTLMFFDSTKKRHKYDLCPNDAKTFADMSNFCYGLRCIIAHGAFTRTISKGGALENDEPETNYYIKSVSFYFPKEGDCKRAEIRERTEYIMITSTKKFGRTASRTKEIWRKEKKGVKHWKETEHNNVKPQKSETEKRNSLKSFDKFLNEADIKLAQDAVEKHCKDLWKNAKANKLNNIDYDLFLSMINFNYYYVGVIAKLCLGICYSVIYGDSDEDFRGFLEKALPTSTKKWKLLHSQTKKK